MMLNIKLIIKAIDGQSISVITEDDRVPFFGLSNLYPNIDETIEKIAQRYGIHHSYVKPKLVTLSVENDEVYAYYTILTPKEFINEKDRVFLCNNFSKLSEQDRIAIRQAISIFPY